MGDTKALQAARKPETAQAMGSRSSRAPAPSAMHRLQRSLGNQGMLRLLRADGHGAPRGDVLGAGGCRVG